MSKLSSDKDRKATKNAVDSMGNNIKLEEGQSHTFIVLLEEDYEQGFIHWIQIGADKIFKRTCKGGLEGKGWSPDECELCALALEQYDLKKEAKEDGDDGLAEEYNTRGKNIKAGYSAVFKVAKIKSIVKRVKNKAGKSVKRFIPDFEDEIEVGKLSLTHAQANRLMDIVGLVDDATGEIVYPFIQDGSDLINRVLDFVKKKDPKRKYAEIDKVIPSKKLVELDIDESVIPDISGEFEVIDDFEKIVELYKGEADMEGEEEYKEEELERKNNKGKGKKSGKKSNKK